MDGLISLLIIIGIAAISSSNKKKKQAKQAANAARKKQAFDDLAEMEKAARPAAARELVLELLKEEVSSPKASPVHPAEKDAAPVQLEMEIPPKKNAKPIVKLTPRTKPAPVLFMDHDEPEGSVSTQGESAEEHERHRQKILAEEEKIRSAHEELEEIRNMNLKKLRTAVVMSEILDKPVSLRSRRC